MKGFKGIICRNVFDRISKAVDNKRNITHLETNGIWYLIIFLQLCPSEVTKKIQMSEILHFYGGKCEAELEEEINEMHVFIAAFHWTLFLI